VVKAVTMHIMSIDQTQQELGRIQQKYEADLAYVGRLAEIVVAMQIRVDATAVPGLWARCT